MSLSGYMFLALAMTVATATSSLGQEAEDAYRIRASIYANADLITAATWVGVRDRTTTLEQTFSTPYRRDTALSQDGVSVEDTLKGEVVMTVRPFHHRGALCLDVEINIHTVSQLYHYRSESLLEVLPGGGGYGASGDYCDFEQTAEGLLFSLSHGNDKDYGEILVTPEKPVAGPG